MKPSMISTSAAWPRSLALVFCLWCAVASHESLASAARGAKPKCPDVCKCYPSEDFNSTTFRLFRREDVSSSMVFCLRQGLTRVPPDMPPGVSRLHLSHNLIVSLDARTFENVTWVTALVLAGNLISRIENDTFHGLMYLKYLDLSDNLMRTIPELMLCPWKMARPEDEEDLNPVERIQCPVLQPRGILSLDLSGNRWHCTCYLQQIIKAYSCFRTLDYICVKFLPMAEDPSAIGYCSSPPNIKNIPLNRLRAEEIREFPRAQMVNLCLQRSPHVDVVLLVVMFSWMGITMGCVMHFVAWNNREVERHKSYIAGLEKANPHSPVEPAKALASRRHQPSVSKQSSFGGIPEERRNPDIAINGNIVERSGRPDELRRFIRQASTSPQPSPVWKPRSQRHHSYPAPKRAGQYSPRAPTRGYEALKR